MLGSRKIVGGGRRGGNNGGGGRRGGNNGGGGRRDDERVVGSNSARGGGGRRRYNRGHGSRDDRGDHGGNGRVAGGNSTGGDRGGSRNGFVGSDSSRRGNDVSRIGDGGSMRDGAGGNSRASGSRGRGGWSLKVGGASGSRRGGNRNLDGGGAGGDRGKGRKSVSGGSGTSSHVGGRSGNVCGRGRAILYDASSEDSDYDDADYDDAYDDDQLDDDQVDNDLGGNNDGGVNGSEGEDSEGEGSEGEGSEGEGSEGEAREGGGGDGEESEDEAVIAQHNRRGFSLGLFGRPPPQPVRIRMVGRVIDSPIACRTLLALMRVHWPAGCVGAKDVDRRIPKWWRRIRNMFFKYYEFDPEYGTIDDAREAVLRHMRRNMRKTLCRERDRIQEIIKKNGGSFIDHIPPYFSEAVWKPICDHWESPVFHKRSNAAKEARKHQQIPHTSGATSFQRRAWDIKEKTGKEPKNYDLFIRMHTKDKENKEFTSEAVRVIVKRYLDKCEEQNRDPFEAPIDTWVEVVGVRKNTIIGIPRTSASELIPLPPTSGKRRRRRCVDDESGASTGKSIIEHMSDDFVMQAVDRTVAFARSHPDQFDLAPEHVNLLAQSVAEGASELPVDHPLTMTTMRELVQVMVSVLGDVYARNRPTSNCNKGKMVAREEEHSSDNDDERRFSSPPPGRSRSGSLRIMGD